MDIKEIIISNHCTFCTCCDCVCPARFELRQFDSEPTLINWDGSCYGRCIVCKTFDTYYENSIKNTNVIRKLLKIDTSANKTME